MQAGVIPSPKFICWITSPDWKMRAPGRSPLPSPAEHEGWAGGRKKRFPKICIKMKSWIIKCNCILGKEPPHCAESLCAPTVSVRFSQWVREGGHTAPHPEGPRSPLQHQERSTPAGKGRFPPEAPRRARDTVTGTTALPARDTAPGRPPVTPPSRPRPLGPAGRNRARYKFAAPAGCQQSSAGSSQTGGILVG